MSEENEAPSRENPKFGRKVFFLNPPLSFDKGIIEPLRDEEYEIYVLPDIPTTKPILLENKDAMLFINIDHTMTFKQWFNYILSFREDPVLRTIFIGVVSERATTSDQQLFLEHLTLQCGFQIISSSTAILLKNFQKILELNGAKGNRKYIRLDCKDINVVSACFINDNKLYEIQINNISSVGFACTFDERSAPLFKENAVFNNISFTFGRTTIVCPSVVFRIMDSTAVFLFTNAMPLRYKEAIRKFIHTVLIKKFDIHAKNTMMKDMTNYPNVIDMSAIVMAKEAEKKKEIFDGDTDFGNLENVDEP